MYFGLYLFYKEVWKVEWFDVVHKLFLEMLVLDFFLNKEQRGIPFGSLWSNKLLVAIRR
jgi:hypothetical protein